MAWSCIAKDRARSAGRTGLRNTAAEESIILCRITSVDASHYNAATGCTCCCCRWRWRRRPSSSSASERYSQTGRDAAGVALKLGEGAPGVALHAHRGAAAAPCHVAVDEINLIRRLVQLDLKVGGGRSVGEEHGVPLDVEDTVGCRA